MHIDYSFDSEFRKIRFGLKRSTRRDYHDGKGEVFFVSVDRGNLTITTRNNVRFRYLDGRWVGVSRDRLECILQVWPGYIDALEQMTDFYSEACDKVHQKLEDYCYNVFSEAKQLHSKFRHKNLKSWREENPNNVSVPEQLKGIRHIKRFHQEGPSHVYFLLKNSKVVYVGQTTQWPHRLTGHKDKDYDDVWYLEVCTQDLNTVESSYINKFKPSLNKRFPEVA